MPIDPDVAAMLAPIQEDLVELKKRVDALDLTASKLTLFAARDNFETAVLSQMAGLSDEEQAALFDELAQKVSG